MKLRYCDGASFAGDAKFYNGVQLYSFFFSCCIMVASMTTIALNSIKFGAVGPKLNHCIPYSPLLDFNLFFFVPFVYFGDERLAHFFKIFNVVLGVIIRQ